MTDLTAAADEPLPTFRYHPDPIATGTVRAESTECPACERERSHVYVGPTYSEVEVDEELCPWCIADGTAAEALDATFVDVDSIEDEVPDDVLDVLERRTPSFTGWQQERWLTHCGDAAAFVGRAGWDEVADHPDAIEALREDSGLDGAALDEWLHVLHRDGDATAYLFRCLHCGVHLAYADAS